MHVDEVIGASGSRCYGGGWGLVRGRTPGLEGA
jgi:hypothetical protein